MTSSLHNSQKQLTAFSFWWSMQEPFWGSLFAWFPKPWSAEVYQLAILPFNNSSLHVVINPQFGKDLEQAQFPVFADKVKHELLHLLLGHPFQRTGYSNTPLFDAACDLSINQLTGKSFKNSYSPLHFPEIDFSSCKKLNDFYQLLLNAFLSDPNVGATLAQNQQLVADHNSWQAYAKLSIGQKQLLQQKVADLFRQLTLKNKSTPSLPTALTLTIREALSTAPSVNWKNVLKQFVARNTGSKLVNVMSRPSKRYGTSPGIKIKARKKFLVAVDTSGSIDQEQLELFYQEIHQLWRLDIDLEIVSCDYEIRQRYRYKGRFPSVREGGHVTNFTPPIVLANEQSKLCGIVYFTDGRGAAPQVKSRWPILWLIANESEDRFEHLPGRKVWLKMENQT